MATITIHGGHKVQVDEEDLQLIAPYKWYLRNGYAATAVHRKGSSKTDKNRTINIQMHRLIMGDPEYQVDHVNRVRLDNRRQNLRLATHKQNTWNSDKSVGACGYRGVRQESPNVFAARLGKQTVGYYDSVLKAAQARDLAAIAQRGEFAILNFKKEDLPGSVEALPPRNVGERTSTVVGVSFAKNQKRKARWRVVYKKRHIGWFETEGQAIVAKNEAENADKIST